MRKAKKVLDSKSLCSFSDILPILRYQLFYQWSICILWYSDHLSLAKPTIDSCIFTLCKLFHLSICDKWRWGTLEPGLTSAMACLWLRDHDILKLHILQVMNSSSLKMIRTEMFLPMFPKRPESYHCKHNRKSQWCYWSSCSSLWSFLMVFSLHTYPPNACLENVGEIRRTHRKIMRISQNRSALHLYRDRLTPLVGTGVLNYMLFSVMKERRLRSHSKKEDQQLQRTNPKACWTAEPAHVRVREWM